MLSGLSEEWWLLSLARRLIGDKILSVFFLFDLTFVLNNLHFLTVVNVLSVFPILLKSLRTVGVFKALTSCRFWSHFSPECWMARALYLLSLLFKNEFLEFFNYNDDALVNCVKSDYRTYSSLLILFFIFNCGKDAKY